MACCLCTCSVLILPRATQYELGRIIADVDGHQHGDYAQHMMKKVVLAGGTVPQGQAARTVSRGRGQHKPEERNGHGQHRRRQEGHHHWRRSPAAPAKGLASVLRERQPLGQAQPKHQELRP